MNNVKVTKSKKTNHLTSRQKKQIDASVKKTVKQYGKTLELLAKT